MVRLLCAHKSEMKKWPAPKGTDRFFIFLSYPVLSQEHRADKTLIGVPAYRCSRCYFPSRISQRAVHELRTYLLVLVVT